MGEIRIVGPGKTRGYPDPVCKKRIVGPGKTRGYPNPVCKKRIVGPGKTRGYPYPVCRKNFFPKSNFIRKDRSTFLLAPKFKSILNQH